VQFLRFEIYKHVGKSARDEHRSIAEIKKMSLARSESLRGVAPPTLNRHLGFLQQLIDFIPTQGVVIDHTLTTRGLRARASKTQRDRYARAKSQSDSAVTFFGKNAPQSCDLYT
jgi:hypothetical protein